MGNTESEPRYAGSVWDGFREEETTAQITYLPSSTNTIVNNSVTNPK